MAGANERQEAWVKAGELSLDLRKSRGYKVHKAADEMPDSPYILVEFIGHNGRLFEVILESAGYKTSRFYSAAEAIAKMLVLNPGLALCYADTGEGMILLEERATIPDLHDVPVVFINNWGKEKGRDFPRAVLLGAHSCIQVPFEPTELVKIARELIG